MNTANRKERLHTSASAHRKSGLEPLVQSSTVVRSVTTSTFQ